MEEGDIYLRGVVDDGGIANRGDLNETRMVRDPGGKGGGASSPCSRPSRREPLCAMAVVWMWRLMSLLCTIPDSSLLCSASCVYERSRQADRQVDSVSWNADWHTRRLSETDKSGKDLHGDEQLGSVSTLFG